MSVSIHQRAWHHVVLFVAVLTVSLFAYALPTSAQSAAGAYIAPGTIDIDADFSDWPAGTQIINESAKSDIDLTDYWCWNSTTGTWSSVSGKSACVNSYLFNEQGQIDIRKAYFGLNQSQMYVGIETTFPFGGVLNTSTNEYVKIDKLWPSLGVSSLPVDFQHDFVFAFGPATDNTYTHYIVVHVIEDADLTTDLESGESDLVIYKESGQTAGFQKSEDTALGTLPDEADEISFDKTGPSTSFEVRQDLGKFFELTGLKYQKYGMRLETHSDPEDYTDRVVVNFGLAKKAARVTERYLSAKKVKKTGALLDWHTTSNATKYNVQVQKYEGGVWEHAESFKNLTKSRRQLTDTHVNPNTKYRFRVQACNSINCAGWTQWKEFKTKK
jgi:hypothetical protein